VIIRIIHIINHSTVVKNIYAGEKKRMHSYIYGYCTPQSILFLHR